MFSELLFERDFLYPTDNSNDPGSIHLQVFSPNDKARLPVVIECKTNHSAVKYFDSILRIIQSDIFDRIVIDLKKSADVYIKNNNPEIKEFDGYNHILVKFTEDRIEFIGVNV